MDPPTYREKGTMTISDTLTSQLQMYINNNVVQSHINICSTNMKPDFIYDNLLDCSSFTNKQIEYNNKPVSNENNSWEYSHPHAGFPFGRCITCPIVATQSSSPGEGEKDLNFGLLRNIATHIKVRSSDVMYKCGHCKANFEQKTDFVEHMKMHTNELQPTPPSTSSSTAAVIAVAAITSDNTCNPHHESSQSPSLPNNDNNDNINNGASNNHNSVQNSIMNTATSTENNSKRFVCQCCNVSYSRKSNLNAHMKSHADGKKPFTCDYCDASYSRRANLNTHVKLHINDTKPFICTMCSAAYSRKSSLDAHIRIHTDGSKPYRCDYCGAAYSRKTNLNAHVKIHTVGRQPFICEFCNASYSRKTNLNTHIRTHTTGKIMFKCEYCSVQYSRKTNLNTHVRTHTGEKPYKCKLCTEAFSRRTDLNSHMKHHPNTSSLPPPVTSAQPIDMNKTSYLPAPSVAPPTTIDYLVPKQNCPYDPPGQSDNHMSAVR